MLGHFKHLRYLCVTVYGPPACRDAKLCHFFLQQQSSNCSFCYYCISIPKWSNSSFIYASHHRNVMRDLTRLLYMLNKKQEKVKIPPDGVQLLTWSEQILNRYLLAQVSGHTYLINQLPHPYLIINRQFIPAHLINCLTHLT